MISGVWFKKKEKGRHKRENILVHTNCYLQFNPSWLLVIRKYPIYLY